MKVLNGTAKGIRFSSELFDASPLTNRSHFADFMLEQHFVCLKPGCPVELNEGDHIIVAGKNKGRKFEALAYNNLTQNVVSSPLPAIAYFMLSITLIFCGLFFIGLGVNVLSFMFSVVLIVIGILIGRGAWLRWCAVRKVNTDRLIKLGVVARD